MNGLGSTTAVADRDVLHPTCSDDFRAERKYLSGVEHVNRADTITVVRPATCYKMQCVQQLFLFSFFLLRYCFYSQRTRSLCLCSRYLLGLHVDFVLGVLPNHHPPTCSAGTSSPLTIQLSLPKVSNNFKFDRAMS